MIIIKAQKVLERTGEIPFKWLLFLTVLPRAIFRTQSKVYGGAILQKLLTTLAVNCFCQKANVRLRCLERKEKQIILFYMLLRNVI